MANLKVSEQAYPSMRYTEAAAPSTPAAGEVIVYAKADGFIYGKDDAGLETALSNVGGGTVATDAIWDAAGDLAVGSGANTAAKLAKGAAGANLSTYNGVVAWNGGTSFPASPASGDRYWRSDLGMECYFDGTRWLTTQLFDDFFHPASNLASETISATSSNNWEWPPPYQGTYDLWVVSASVNFIVNSGGTALGASHKWVGTCVRGNAGTTVATLNIDSGSSGSYRVVTTSVGALLGSGEIFVFTTWTKTGSPGTLHPHTRIRYRIVVT